MHVSHKRAQRRLDELIERGDRLVHVAQRPWKLEREVIDIGPQWGAWYGAVNAVLSEIYPTQEEFEIVRQAQSRAESWPTRIQLIVDRLHDFRETVGFCQPPGVSMTLLTFIVGRPAFRWIVEAILVLLASAIIVKTPDLLAWIRSLRP
jgi:hypothetical protein